MDDVQAELARLKAENEALKRQQASPFSLKVSVKGALSVYGLGRFPVTLYKEQWARLLDHVEDIRAFLQEHDGDLKSKKEVLPGLAWVEVEPSAVKIDRRREV